LRATMRRTVRRISKMLLSSFCPHSFKLLVIGAICARYANLLYGHACIAYGVSDAALTTTTTA
jgi:hypothetical protein